MFEKWCFYQIHFNGGFCRRTKEEKVSISLPIFPRIYNSGFIRFNNHNISLGLSPTQHNANKGLSCLMKFREVQGLPKNILFKSQNFLGAFKEGPTTVNLRVYKKHWGMFLNQTKNGCIKLFQMVEKLTRAQKLLITMYLNVPKQAKFHVMLFWRIY